MNHTEDASASHGCCTPPRQPSDQLATVPGLLSVAASRKPAAGDGDGTSAPVLLPGGEFLMGTDSEEGFAADGEGPMRAVRLSPFRIAPYAVTNTEFGSFVEATGHVTDAERFGWSYVFASFLPAALRGISARVPQTPWWCGVRGANWRAPEGPGSDVEGRGRHPVVHVSWRDAQAYCAWVGGRLPTEAEWEYASRGGLEQRRYPWGDELTPGGEHRCNIWQGHFPTKNTLDDGHRGTAPVDTYAPNGFGLYNTAGNVWEWCADWWTTDHDRPDTPANDLTGPAEGTAKVIRGGSYLCHDSYCNRYRVAARTSNTPDSTTGHMGFRCAFDADA
ncbi:formylglycine-generating enzyme family protein [Streptomyces sp. NPDC056121]|uniref:formylglycine-generating enzyme family protein n=1 Tax=unclassified Streptomyces TaxID=2593676 RepID=UPI0033210C99